MKNYTLICLMMFACSVRAQMTSPLDEINLQLKWKHGFQFAGYYVAVEKGFYEDAGLQVNLIEHDGVHSPTQVLLNGDSQYSVTGSQIIMHRAQGKPVVVLAAIYQHSPYAFLVRGDSNIKSVEDFKGRRVMMIDDGLQNAELLATLRRAGLSEKDYQYIPSSFDPLSLVRDETDVFNAYVSDQGFVLDEAGVRNRYILPNQYGVDFYGDVLVTTEKEISNNPERVQAFLDASLKGWEYALRHPEEIIDLIIEKYNSQNLSREHLEYQSSAMRELIQPLLVKIGYMNEDRWKHIQEIFQELDFVVPDRDMSGLMYQQKKHALTIADRIAANWVSIAVFLVFLVVLGLSFFTVQLRRLVVKRTEDLQESEQYWRALINAEPACVKTLNKNGELLSMSDAGLAMIDAKSIEQVRGKKMSMLIDKAHQNDFIALNKKVFDGGSGSLLFKLTGLKGRSLWLETHAVPFRDRKGRITRLLAVMQDVTERVSSEEEKDQLQYELQMSQKMEALGRLSGGIAHDFNNLLGIIMGYAEIAMLNAEKVQYSKLPRHLLHIKEAGVRAKGLVNQMLVFSRSDFSDTKAVQLLALIKDDIKLLRSALPSSIEIHDDIAENLPLVVFSPTHLNQVLMNFAINARDAMDNQGALSISLKVVNNLNCSCNACLKPVSGEWVELAVRDTGSGISEQVLEKMFTPFFTTKDVGKGSGMGLAVVYGIVHNSGGHILVDTLAGVGTTFRMLLPVSDAREESSGENEVSQQMTQGESEHILIVDDEQSLGDFLGELLTENGYQVTVMSDSDEAWSEFQKDEQRYSLLVTDQTMPGLTGMELANNIRALGSTLPIILCTGYSDNLSVEKMTELSVTCTQKPVDIEDFLHMVKSSIDQVT